jgi:glycosyltransferase involved in cell wall biosynthesis
VRDPRGYARIIPGGTILHHAERSGRRRRSTRIVVAGLVFKVSAPHPRVSVIIPSYNRAGLISQAIDSALQQTFGDHEVIVVDDGSTDETAAVVRAYGDRVGYVWTPNGGAGHARNVGMAHARGDYLTFLDSDDLLYPYALEVSTRLLARFPSVAMVCSEVTGFDDHGFVDRYHMKRYHAPTYRKPGLTYDTIFPSSVQLLETGAIPSELLRDDPTLATRRAYYGNVYDSYLVDIVLFQNSSMVRREVIDALGPRNERLFCYEELDYLVKLSRGHDVLFADVPTYKLRYHPDQLSTTAGRNGRAVWLRKQRELLRVMKRHIVADPIYYEKHKPRLERRLAELHRAVAVPLLLADESTPSRHRSGRSARVYLECCRRLGHRAPGLWLASFAPPALRRLAVTIVEDVRLEGVKGLLRRGVNRLWRKLGQRSARGRQAAAQGATD